MAGDNDTPNNNTTTNDNNTHDDDDDVVLLSDNLAPFPDVVSEHPNPNDDAADDFRPHLQKLRPIRGNTPLNAENSSDLGFLPNQTLDPHGGASTVFSDLKQIKIELEAELSSSSDDASGEYSDASEEGTSRKRKRKTKKTIALFMEKMVRKVMEKQEMMHRELMETLETREKERMAREEAIKQQEIKRAKRDEELRSQERARSLALIAFIEKLLGLEIPIPEAVVPASPSSMEKNPSSMEKYDEGGQFQDPSSSKRWPKSEIQALIAVRSGLDEKFVKGPKNSVWEEVAVTLCNMGYKRTAKKCKEKWENINKYYRRTTESGRKRPQNSKACPYFQELELLYKSGFIASPNQSNSNEKLAIEYSSPFSQ